MRYLPHTEDEIRAMLERIGVGSIDDLFQAIPPSHRLERPLAVEPALDEASLMAHLEQLADRNDAARALSFLGGGIYDHHVPPAVDQLLTRSEFYTAYTPYQAEVSQGTLQSIYEFQTLVAELFGLEVANASMYDGASATAEALLMARRVTKRSRCLLSRGLHPEYVETARTYLESVDEEGPALELAPLTEDGVTDLDALESLIDEETAAVVIGYPSFLGCVEDLGRAAELCHAKGALLVTTTAEPYALSVLKPPGALGADIAVGEGQPLAVPPQLGGPGVGLFAARQKHVRQLPGRLVGETVDAEGKRGFVLTLSTREQHIRRERATSNICTNHGLIALAFTIRTAMLGRRGFEQVGRLCLSRAEYLKKRIDELERFSVPAGAPTFNEFVVRREEGKAAPLLAALAAKGVLAGLDLGRFYPERDHEILVAVTERHDRASLDRLVEALGSV
ncbi:MAG TPA: aminomethyl-transferring glycine dehydrogenase subunit GcvPA [Sandaracinaceae bacterium LLY-WYZ-13_1]|nr:aminomethyl-transferring glycine dehydrogenase subunit GcvPA [Sandaracinaceae bacterium LLY-WYZ-13_1]